MQLTTTVLSLLALSTSALAAPAPASADAVSMMASASTWTIKSFKRTCDTADKSCSYSYSIDTHSGSPTACSYKVSGSPASRTGYQNVKCGAYTIGSNWSGQFGAGQGFQTLSVVKAKQIVYPAYTDTQLKSGKTVSPDQSYTPQNLP